MAKKGRHQVWIKRIICHQLKEIAQDYQLRFRDLRGQRTVAIIKELREENLSRRMELRERVRLLGQKMDLADEESLSLFDSAEEKLAGS